MSLLTFQCRSAARRVAHPGPGRRFGHDRGMDDHASRGRADYPERSAQISRVIHAGPDPRQAAVAPPG